MNRVHNLHLEEKVLQDIATKFNLNTPRTYEEIHLSDLIYCLTKGYLGRQGTSVRCSKDEVLSFSTGLALEQILRPINSETPLVTYCGITYRPDFMLATNLGELKSTRAGIKKHLDRLPDSWIRYQLGGCKIMGTTTYDLVTILVAERPRPVLYAETIEYTQEEIDKNWQEMEGRLKVFKNSLLTDTMPAPRKYNASWECNGCRYLLICDALEGTEMHPGHYILLPDMILPEKDGGNEST